MRVIICAEIDLLIIDHDQYLPRLAILGDSSVLRPSVSAAEFAMVNFLSAHYHVLVHFDVFLGVS